MGNNIVWEVAMLTFAKEHIALKEVKSRMDLPIVKVSFIKFGSGEMRQLFCRNCNKLFWTGPNGTRDGMWCTWAKDGLGAGQLCPECGPKVAVVVKIAGEL